MLVQQNVNNPALDRLKQDWVAVPTLVLLPRHVAVAQELISATVLALDIVPDAGDTSDPARPALAGRLWEEVPADARRLYVALTQKLDSASSSESWSEGAVAEAAALVNQGLTALSRLPQQPMSGMVQRHS